MCSGFCWVFCRQFFDIGRRSGSIIQEALNIFRTFQRISATKSFSARLSNDCLKMFKWASDLIDIIVGSLFNVKPFSSFELFIIFAVIFPATILTFLGSLSFEYKQSLIFILCPFILIIGAGFSYIKNLSIIIIVICYVIAPITLILIIVFYYCCCKKKTEESEPDIFDMLLFTKAVLKSGIVFICMMSPFCLLRYKLQILITAVALALLVITFIIELIKNICFDELETYLFSINSFLADLFSLLIVPTAERFAEINQMDKYENYWSTILGFVGALLIPILMNLTMILASFDDADEQYRGSICCATGFFLFLDLIDNVKQIMYAIFAAYDKPWACIGLEVCWITIIIALLPYRKVSDYILSIGNSAIMLISNGAALYAESYGTDVFSFKFTVICVVFACVPSILAILFYFIFDFETDMDSGIKINEDRLFLIFGASLIGLPLFFFIYGSNLSFILDILLVNTE